MWYNIKKENCMEAILCLKIVNVICIGNVS